MYFVRLNPKGITEKTLESDVATGEVTGAALENFRALVADLYIPIVQEQQQWGKVPTEHLAEFVASMQKFGSMLTEAAHTVGGGVEFSLPDQRYEGLMKDMRPAALAAAAGDDECLAHMESCISDWCRETEHLLAQTNGIKEGEEPGPDTELEYWRTRMSNFNSITEHLKVWGGVQGGREEGPGREGVARVRGGRWRGAARRWAWGRGGLRRVRVCGVRGDWVTRSLVASGPGTICICGEGMGAGHGSG